MRDIEELQVLPKAMLEDLEQVVRLYKSDMMYKLLNILGYNWMGEPLYELW